MRAAESDAALPRAPRSRRGPAKEIAYEYVKDLIVNRTLLPGTFVTEMEVADAVGVSRTPVREAFLRLEGERLIQLLPRRGAMVTPVTLRELHEVNETRMLIEIHAAKVVCAQRIPIAAQLRELLAEQRTLLKDDATRFIDADRSFHMALVTAAGNRVLSEVYGSLRDRQQRTGLAAVAARPGRASRVLRDHRAILTAVAAYDAAAAEEAIRAHLEQSLAELQQRLRG